MFETQNIKTQQHSAAVVTQSVQCASTLGDMASRPRAAGQQHGGQGGKGGRIANRVEDILQTCPPSMGTGLLVDDTESSGRLRVRAVATIKGLLEQVKANIKVWCMFSAPLL